MACSGLENDDSEETQTAIAIAFEFIKVASRLEGVKLKIGIHFGSVIAGVIGYHKPQFSLIGDTVNTSSRVCSHGEEGKVTISLEAYKRVLESEYVFQERLVEAKGKGIIPVYRVCLKENKHGRRFSLPAPLNLEHNKEYTTFKHKIESVQKTQRLSNQTQSFQQPFHGTHSGMRDSRILPDQRRSKIVNLNKHQSQNLSLIRRKQQHNSFMTPPPQWPVSTINGEDGQFQLKFDSDYEEKKVNREPEKIREKAKTSYIQQVVEQVEDELVYKQVEWFPEKRMGYGLESSLTSVSMINEQEDNVEKSESLLKYNEWTLLLGNNPKKIVDGLNQFDSKVRNNNEFSFVFACLFIHGLRSILQLGEIVDDQDRIFFMSRVIVFFGSLGSILTTSHSAWLYPLLSLTTFITTLFLQFSSSTPSSRIHMDILETHFYLFAGASHLRFMSMIVYVLLSAVVLVIIEQSISLLTSFVLFLVLLIISRTNYSTVLSNYNSLLNHNLKKSRKDSLLTNLLPAHVLTKFYSRLKLQDVSDHLTQATLLFADIAGFTAYSSSVTARQVVNMLRQLMTEFDKECLNQNVYKVYTIGDCYVVLGINNMEQRNPALEARNVVEMGLEMLNIIQKVRAKVNFEGLNMRIGIHTVFFQHTIILYFFVQKGEFYGGIIGTDIVRYDIFGLDAVIANKMESQGQAAKVQNIFHILNQFFRSTFQKTQRFQFKIISLISINLLCIRLQNLITKRQIHILQVGHENKENVQKNTKIVYYYNQKIKQILLQY